MGTVTAYDDTFFASQRDGSLRSANVVAPLVNDLLAPRSVCDIGCGVAAWLRAWRDVVEDICGVDGD
jgi:hypothetical protein